MPMFDQTADVIDNDYKTGIVRKDSIEEICGHRARAIELYALVVETLRQAREAHRRACPGNAGYGRVSLRDLEYSTDSEGFVKDATKSLDQDIWRGLLNATPLGSLMDVKERKTFEESLQNPVPVTPENVYTTLKRLSDESGMIFRRGLVTAFANLNRDYRSHDGFKIGQKIILTYIAQVDALGSSMWVRLYTSAEERLRDIDRVFHVLDGKQAPEYQQGLCAAMRDAMHASPLQWEVETPYFKVKWFKNGNAHLTFKRDDLVRQANRLIAEHYGQAVGAAPDVAGKSPVPDQPPAPATDDFFETPPEIVERMLAHAGIAPEQNVLEPSAGLGAIARGFAETVGGRFTGYEASPERCRALEQAFPHAQIRQADFLRSTPLAGYDRILMNPPFSNGVDALHVIHALKFLAPGGRLVAVMSAGVTFRTTRAALHLKEIVAARGGIIEELPPGSFKASGTNVNTVLVVIDNL